LRLVAADIRQVFRDRVAGWRPLFKGRRSPALADNATLIPSAADLPVHIDVPREIHGLAQSYMQLRALLTMQGPARAIMILALIQAIGLS
jgi:hypothetical protein